MDHQLTIYVNELPPCEHPACAMRATYQVSTADQVSQCCTKHAIAIAENAILAGREIVVARLKEYGDSNATLNR